MRPYACWLAVVSWVLFLPAVVAGSDLKVAVVDLQRCITESVEGKKVYNELKEKKDAMQKQIDIKQDDLLKLSESIEKQSMMLSMDAREDKAKEFERKKREFKYMYEDLSGEIQKAEAEARQRLIVELEGVVSEFGEKEGFSLVFERRSSGIMHFGKTLDITDRVIQLYDQKKAARK